MSGRSRSLAVRAASALTWGAGVAAGVALGAYLTAVGGAGAPGVTALDRSELVTLPLLSGGVTVFAVLLFDLIGGFVRTRASRESHKGHGEQ